jgi:murein L,D-transpeptidase YafK
MKALRLLALCLVAAGTLRLIEAPMVAKIVVSKSQRTLVAYADGGRVVLALPVAFGRQSEGTKEREGDERTPEGEYYVCFKNPRSRFHLSLGLSYPNPDDARRGLEQGLITQADFHEIAAAHAARRVPPWKTPLGGEIFIHGGMQGGGGTAGCIALSDEAIEALFPQVELGTPVVIEP